MMLLLEKVKAMIFRGTGKDYALCLLGLLTFLLGGCAKEKPILWNVPTVYEIHDLGNSNQVKAELRKALRGEANIYGFQEDSAGTPYRFSLTKIENMKQLVEVQLIIKKVTKENHIPVDLTRGVLRFQSVAGTMDAAVVIRGTATPGSTVYLDTGGAGVVTLGSIDADGLWVTRVRATGALQRRNGWIYGIVEKGHTQLYIKINALNAATFSYIPYTQIPKASILQSKIRIKD